MSSHELCGELKRLSSQKLSSARFDVLLSRQVSESGGRRSLEAEIDIMRPYADSSSTTLTMSEIFQAQRVQIRCDQLERQLKDRDALANDYYLRLFNIYNAFKVTFLSIYLSNLLYLSFIFHRFSELEGQSKVFEADVQ